MPIGSSVMRVVSEQVAKDVHARRINMFGEDFLTFNGMTVDFSELLFADDIVLFAVHGPSSETLLQSVEVISASYGALLNRDKCALLEIGVPLPLAFSFRILIPTPTDTTYFGASVDERIYSWRKRL